MRPIGNLANEIANSAASAAGRRIESTVRPISSATAPERTSAATPIGARHGELGSEITTNSTLPVVLAKTADGRPLVSAETLSTLRSLTNWSLAEPLPPNVGDLQLALREVTLSLSPSSPQAHAVLMERMFASLPMPPKESLKTWRDLLAKYPPDVLKRATDKVLETHKWETPPKIAQVVEWAEIDASYRRRLNAKSTLEKAIMRQGWDRKDQSRITGSSNRNSAASKPLYPAV